MGNYINKNKTAIVIAIGLLILGGVFWGAGGNQWIYAQANDFKLIPIPETFTELYFTDFSSLPSRSVAGEMFTFSFAIHNREAQDTAYDYEVYFEYPSGERAVFQRGNVVLGVGTTRIINVSRAWNTTGFTGKVVVSLPDKDQHIDFILTK